MHSGATWRLGHRPALDGLRGIAIGLVLLAHIWPDRWIGGAGMVGVTLFFGLSGFLITALLLEERERTEAVSLRKFYARRARRLLPALVPVLVVASAIELSAGANPTGEVFTVVTYTSNWAFAARGPQGLLTHTWSLAVEEQFYLIWPVVIAASLRRGLTPRRVAVWCLIGAGLSLSLRLGMWLFGGSEAFISASTPTRAGDLLVGCALAAALHAGWHPTRRHLILVCAPFAVALSAYLLFADQVPTRVIALPTLTMLASVPLLLLALRNPAVLTGSVLRWLGRRSYALYLWHFVLISASEWGLWPLPVWSSVVLSLVAAEVSWWVVERRFLVARPATRLRSRPILVG